MLQFVCGLQSSYVGNENFAACKPAAEFSSNLFGKWKNLQLLNDLNSAKVRSEISDEKCNFGDGVRKKRRTETRKRLSVISFTYTNGMVLFLSFCFV